LPGRGPTVRPDPRVAAAATVIAAEPNVLALNVVGVISRVRIEQASTKRKGSTPISNHPVSASLRKMRDKAFSGIAETLIAVLVELTVLPLGLVRHLPRRPVPLLLELLVDGAASERQPQTLQELHRMLSGTSRGAVRSVAISLKIVVMSVSPTTPRSTINASTSSTITWPSSRRAGRV